MAYYTKVLQAGENVRYIGRLHWLIYRHAIVVGSLILVAAFVTLNQPSVQGLETPILLFVVASSLLLFFRPWFHRATTEIVVTDKRIIHKTGWIGRRTQEMNMTKVETVDVNQGIIGRIFGFGDVQIVGTGASWEPLRFVASPLELRNAIMVG